MAVDLSNVPSKITYYDNVPDLIDGKKDSQVYMQIETTKDGKAIWTFIPYNAPSAFAEEDDTRWDNYEVFCKTENANWNNEACGEKIQGAYERFVKGEFCEEGSPSEQDRVTVGVHRFDRISPFDQFRILENLKNPAPDCIVRCVDSTNRNSPIEGKMLREEERSPTQLPDNSKEESIMDSRNSSMCTDESDSEDEGVDGGMIELTREDESGNDFQLPPPAVNGVDAQSLREWIISF